MVGKTKWKPLGLLLPKKTVNINQYCIPGRIAEISAAIKDLKDAGVVVSTTTPHLPLTLRSGQCRRQSTIENSTRQ